MTRLYDELPVPLVRVRCRRCRRPFALWKANVLDEGEWQIDLRGRCQCDLPPKLPAGEELDKLVEIAWRAIRSDRATTPITEFR
jgi:hypothetical protein